MLDREGERNGPAKEPGYIAPVPRSTQISQALSRRQAGADTVLRPTATLKRGILRPVWGVGVNSITINPGKRSTRDTVAG